MIVMTGAVWSAERLAAQRGLQVCHDQCGGNTFAGDVSDGDAELAIGEFEEVVVVSTDALGGAEGAGDVHAGDCGERFRLAISRAKGTAWIG